MSKCPYFHLCKRDDCPYSFFKQCKSFVGWSIIRTLESIPGKVDYNKKPGKALKNKIYFSSDRNNLKTRLFHHLLNTPSSSVRYLSYNRAIQLALSDETIIEPIVFVSMNPSYKDIDKGIQTIESLCEGLVDQNKLILLLTKHTYSNELYERL